LTIEEAGRVSELELDESEVPEAARPLLEWLTERARTQLRQA
jgi:hypothetical protein